MTTKPRDSGWQRYGRASARARSIEDLIAFLMADSSSIGEVVEWARKVVVECLMAVEAEIPDACTGPDGMVGLSWNRNEHHLEVDIHPDGDLEFYYCNRETLESWEAEVPAENWSVPSPALIHRLKHFVAGDY